MKKISNNQILKGEMFKAHATVGQETVACDSGSMEICFGRFTQNSLLRISEIDEATVTLFFNYDPEMSTITQYERFLNYTVFESKNQCRREFSYIYKHVKPYVDFKYTFCINECNETFRDRYSERVYHCNSYIKLEFKNCYMYEILLVLQMYRRFLQLNSKREYWLSKELTRKKWHNLSFVNTALFCDSFSDDLPSDQKLLCCGFAANKYQTKFIDKNTFKNNKLYIQKYRKVLSTACVTDLELYLKIHPHIYGDLRAKFIDLTVTFFSIFSKKIFKSTNLLSKKINYHIVETNYKNIINMWFKPIKKILKCTK